MVPAARRMTRPARMAVILAYGLPVPLFPLVVWVLSLAANSEHVRQVSAALLDALYGGFAVGALAWIYRMYDQARCPFKRWEAEREED